VTEALAVEPGNSWEIHDWWKNLHKIPMSAKYHHQRRGQVSRRSDRGKSPIFEIMCPRGASATAGMEMGGPRV
jgi:hypothetical protein